MSAKIDVTSVQDRDVAEKLESSLALCFADRPKGKDWTVRVKSWNREFYEVVVQSRALERQKLFFHGGDQVVEEIRKWVGLYLPA